MKRAILGGLGGLFVLLYIVQLVRGEVSVNGILTFTVVGLVTGSAYAIASSGLVITYATSNVFNMAHGSVGMFMAFIYWELSTNRGLPIPLALFLTVFVIAPLFGALLERFMMRRLTNATVVASLTVTVGLMVMLIGVAKVIWPPSSYRIERFFPGSSVQVFGVGVSYHEIVTFLTAAIVAGALYYLLNRTRIGIAMRAIVDNRELLALHGARPQLLGMLSWGIGSSLAALAGILLAPVVQLDYITLTLIVINAYAAAMVGRLKSLPKTFAGALILGMLIEHSQLMTGWVPESLLDNDNFSNFILGVRSALPTLFLFATMLLLPQERLRVGVVEGASLARLPSRRKAVGWGVALVASTAVVVNLFEQSSQVTAIGKGLAFALIMLSLVVLTGYGGDVSLAQMSMAGIGVLVVVRTGSVNPFTIVMAGVIAGLTGAVLAFPALRMRGLYIGLGTLAMAAAMEKLVFESTLVGFNLGGVREVERLAGFTNVRSFAVLVSAVFALMAYFVLSLRRGRFGRLLLATRDSPAACGTLGLSITRTRVTVFAISSAMAGVAGAFFAGMLIAVGSTDFLMLQSLPLLLMAVVGGISSVTGALVGGMFLGMQNILPSVPADASFILRMVRTPEVSVGFLALFGTNANGMVGVAFDKTRQLLKLRDPVPETALPNAVADEAEMEVSAVAAS